MIANSQMIIRIGFKQLNEFKESFLSTFLNSMFLGLESAKIPIFNVFPLQTHVVGMKINKVSGDI